MRLTPDEQARYRRHLSLEEIGAAGQRRLGRARVLVVGAGGLGCPAAQYLAAAGVGTLGLVDHDVVELSNLQRQVLFSTADIGRPKVEAARERLLALNPGVRVEAHRLELGPDNAAELMADYDLVLDGSDRLATRYLVNDACVLLARPLVSAAIHRFEGQALTYVPGAGPCYRCLFPEADDSVATSCAEAGVLGVLPGVLGSLQAAEAIKLLLGIGTPLAGRLLVFDALEMQFDTFRLERRPDCAVCGEMPSITGLRAPPPVPRISAGELRARRTAPGGGPAVIDVRTPEEFAEGHLSEALNIPLDELATRLDELPAGELVFVCATGRRSEAACRQAGREQAANLAGGLQAWDEEGTAP